MIKFTRIALIFSLIATFATPFAQASFDIPSHVYTVNDLSSAQQHAADSNKPITFVYSNKNTNCGLATAASKDLFSKLGACSVIVYAEREDWKSLPAIVKDGINSPKSGEYIPKTIVVNSNLDQVVCIIPYAKTKKRKQLIRQARDIIESY
jgi:hypothetical protein